MTLLGMIKEWRKGCSCGPNQHVSCPECTFALIDAMERKLSKNLLFKARKIDIKFECDTSLFQAQAKSIISQINKSLDTFNYPECLDRIVDVAVAVDRAEKEILRFKELDRVEEKHREMMSRMSMLDLVAGDDVDVWLVGGKIFSKGGDGSMSGWWN